MYEMWRIVTSQVTVNTVQMSSIHVVLISLMINALHEILTEMFTREWALDLKRQISFTNEKINLQYGKKVHPNMFSIALLVTSQQCKTYFFIWLWNTYNVTSYLNQMKKIAQVIKSKL